MPGDAELELDAARRQPGRRRPIRSWGAKLAAARVSCRTPADRLAVRRRARRQTVTLTFQPPAGAGFTAGRFPFLRRRRPDRLRPAAARPYRNQRRVHHGPARRSGRSEESVPAYGVLALARGDVPGLRVDVPFGAAGATPPGYQDHGRRRTARHAAARAWSADSILNLMPCVFPVLGIKILGFVNQAGADRRKVTLHGLVFALGVLVSFCRAGRRCSWCCARAAGNSAGVSSCRSRASFSRSRCCCWCSRSTSAACSRSACRPRASARSCR